MLHHELLEKKRIEEQLRTANLVQSRLLPAVPPQLPGYIVGICIPTFEIGGDYFDHLLLPDGRRGIVVADVAGKGIPAALIMVAFRALLRAHARDEPEIGRLMRRISSQIGDFTGPTRYVTAVYGVLHPAEGRFEYANCGHNAPLLVRADGRTEWLESSGTFLGLFFDSRYEVRSVVLGPRDVLLLYTGGVVDCENTNGEEFGRKRLASLVQESRWAPASELIAGVLDATRNFSASSFSQMTSRCSSWGGKYGVTEWRGGWRTSWTYCRTSPAPRRPLRCQSGPAVRTDRMPPAMGWLLPTGRRWPGSCWAPLRRCWLARSLNEPLGHL